MDLLYDILEIICDKLDFLSQIRFRQLDSFVYENIQMTNFYDIDRKYLKRLNDDILLMYPYILSLDASYSKNITCTTLWFRFAQLLRNHLR